MKLFNRMRNTGYALLGGLALLSFSAVTTGCSNNEQDGLYAAANTDVGIKSIVPEVPDGYDASSSLLKIGSGSSEKVFKVNCNTRWTVEVTDCEGAWCQIVYDDNKSDGVGQLGDGTFSIEVAPNRSNNNRECNVVVYPIDSEGTHLPGKSKEIHVEQERQSIQVDYAGDVISSYGTNNGTLPVVKVTADQAWTVSSSHSWVKINPGEGMDGDNYTPAIGSSGEKTVSFTFSVDANNGTSTRYAEVTISSPTSAFTPQRLNVTQEGSTQTFLVTPTEIPQVTYMGDTVEISVYSPNDNWTASVTLGTEWMSIVGEASGQPSGLPVTIKVKIEANSAASLRTGTVSIIRPREGSEQDDKTDVVISQNGNPDVPNPDGMPRVSMPWITDGWTATYAQICAYFSSPNATVTGGGVYYRNLDDGNDQGRVEGRIGADNMIVTDMTNLRPNTRYEVSAYVEYDGSQVANGSAITFTTPGLDGEPGSGIPGQDDNNPPSPNN